MRKWWSSLWAMWIQWNGKGDSTRCCLPRSAGDGAADARHVLDAEGMTRSQSSRRPDAHWGWQPGNCRWQLLRCHQSTGRVGSAQSPAHSGAQHHATADSSSAPLRWFPHSSSVLIPLPVVDFSAFPFDCHFHSQRQTIAESHTTLHTEHWSAAELARLTPHGPVFITPALTYSSRLSPSLVLPICTMSVNPLEHVKTVRDVVDGVVKGIKDLDDKVKPAHGLSTVYQRQMWECMKIHLLWFNYKHTLDLRDLETNTHVRGEGREPSQARDHAYALMRIELKRQGVQVL